MEWISVKDRLPERTKEGFFQNVIACTEYGHVLSETAFCNGECWISTISWEGKITLWQPLPNPPKGPENKKLDTGLKVR